MSYAPTAGLARRHAAIRTDIARLNLDAFVITALPNVLYLSNFTGSSAIVVLAADRLLFLTDSRYTTVVRETHGAPYECPGLELVQVEGSYDAKLADVLVSNGWPRVLSNLKTLLETGEPLPDSTVARPPADVQVTRR